MSDGGRGGLYLQAVAADGLVARTGVEALMQGGGRRHQQAAHFGAVALKHGHTFATLGREGGDELALRERRSSVWFSSTHHQVEGSDRAVS